MYDREDLKWNGDDLCLGKRVIASVDRTGPGFRVRMPDGRLSDWANIYAHQGCRVFAGLGGPKQAGCYSAPGDRGMTLHFKPAWLTIDRPKVTAAPLVRLLWRFASFARKNPLRLPRRRGCGRCFVCDLFCFNAGVERSQRNTGHMPTNCHELFQLP
jgi:hypothetical protein